MVTEATARYALPLLSAGQAHKEVTHNEALVRIDALLQASVVSSTAVAPPASPAEGEMWILPAGSIDAWAQHSGEIALWQGGAWTFLSPSAGCCAWVRSERSFALFDGQEWLVGIWPVKQLEIAGEIMLGVRQPAIADPVGGATVDQEARSAVQEVLEVLRAHGLIYA